MSVGKTWSRRKNRHQDQAAATDVICHGGDILCSGTKYASRGANCLDVARIPFRDDRRFALQVCG
jgi:hypothetical protein